ncbi:MAG: response regulator [Sporolactobacillus sp.]
MNQEQKTHVLVVDDQYGIRLLLREVLKKSNISTLVAANAQQAIDFAEKDKPAIALVDMKIPGTNGIEIMKKIKAVYPPIQVMMMTAYGDEAMIRDATANGAVAFFAKPFDLDELTRTVKEAIARHEQQGEKISNC